MDKSNWDFYAPFYNLIIRKDKKAYEQMYRRMRRVVKNKIVLEIATGTGLIAKNIASAAKQIEATDFSEKMIAEAKKGKNPANLSFKVMDAENLEYGDGSFDVVIISNALHIMPDPSRALSEIGRVLNDGGILIAPTFIHGEMRGVKGIIAKIMGIFGFEAENKWSTREYIAFLEENGWRVRRYKILKATFPLVYAECVKI